MKAPVIGAQYRTKLGRCTLHPVEEKMEEDRFVYDRAQSYENNFSRWYNMNCDERSYYNEKLYTREEGRQVFKQFIKNAREHSEQT